MTKYAESTSVPADRSQTEIKRVLAKYGVRQTQFSEDLDAGVAVVKFALNNRIIKLHLPLPAYKDFETTPTGQWRHESTQQKAYEQAIRQRWRALLLVIKAKLEAVESGITTFDLEFMAHIVLPNKLTVGEYVLPKVDEAWQLGKMPTLMIE